ncbi:AmpG family muropeptide MFS transporter [Enterovirga rhinocerotis]|uniref:PAT family beta-lactamase induction signal transducer AmpG n=1 Tax=Enterovirga rhinocerotis TaxID=1339210 RepID=A0A4R7C441_9HYPH|nr:MFS transporter [Enterovirga rhinocerotis]TDR93270.1 PAT family beta-lactamase induction signal transducer AmpG [Enterovirga rhinocerotis]
MLTKLRPYLDRRVMLMLALGFSCGLPFLLVAGTFSARLATAEIDIKAIGLFAYLLLPYSLKFLWAPIVDAIDLPFLSRRLGRRRSWMVASQVCVALALLAMAAADPISSLPLLGLAAFLMAFSAATQDIVIDAWRIESTPVERQGLMLAAYQLGYRLALITAGAGALILVSELAGPDAAKEAMSASWKVAYLVMAALMLVGITASLLAPAPPEAAPAAGKPREPFHFGRAIVAPLADLYRRQGPRLIAVLALVAFYRLPDFVSGVMANPFYIKMGYTLPQIAAVSKLYGIWVGMLGAFVGGWAIIRYGLYPVLIAGAIAGAASNLAFSWLAMGPPEVWRLTVAISVENFSGTFAGTALMAYMSSLTGLGFAATQYALLSSLYALPGKLVSGLSGFMVAAWGFPVFFAATAAVGLPVVILAILFGRGEAEKEAGPGSDAGAPDAVSPPRPA